LEDLFTSEWSASLATPQLLDVGCRFCGAGDYFVRSLTAEEIVSQPDYLLDYTGVHVPSMKRLQIMFMSMGEPLLNRALEPAIEELHRKYQNAALLISTSAPDVDYEWVTALSERVPTVGLQFSVHESTDEALRLSRLNTKSPFEQIHHEHDFGS